MIKNLLFLFLLFAFQANAQVVPNNSFENWEEYEPGWEAPENYFTSDIEYQLMDVTTEDTPAETNHPITVTKTTPGKTGTYAVKLRNEVGTLTVSFPTLPSQTRDLDTVAGTLNLVSEDGLGMEVTQRVATLSGFYKFTQGAPNGSLTLDTAYVTITLSKWNDQTEEPDYFGLGFLQIYNNASGFTAFNVNVAYDDATTVPDTAQIFIASSFTKKRFPGTELIVDDLVLTTVTGNKIPLFAKSVEAYPNPATEQLNIKNLPESASHIQVRDYTGKVRSITPVSSGTTNVITHELGTGVYFYSILDAEGVILYSDKFNVAD